MTVSSIAFPSPFCPNNARPFRQAKTAIQLFAFSSGDFLCSSAPFVPPFRTSGRGLAAQNLFTRGKGPFDLHRLRSFHPKRTDDDRARTHVARRRARQRGCDLCDRHTEIIFLPYNDRKRGCPFGIDEHGGQAPLQEIGRQSSSSAKSSISAASTAHHGDKRAAPPLHRRPPRSPRAPPTPQAHSRMRTAVSAAGVLSPESPFLLPRMLPPRHGGSSFASRL